MMEEKVVFTVEDGLKKEVLKYSSANPNTSKYFIYVKRFTDIFGSLVGLILLLPLFIVLFILMKVEDYKAPFIYSQERIGKNKKKFKMYKIRSMCVDADKKLEELLILNEIDGAMFKMKDDPRVTRIGKFIRKYSIDELPQLWNVLTGNMSLVGPRPPLPREIKDYKETDFNRLSVKPGCTGLWQISGRNNIGFDRMVELDLDYINNQSILFDLKIMLKTVLVIVKPDGAY